MRLEVLIEKLQAIEREADSLEIIVDYLNDAGWVVKPMPRKFQRKRPATTCGCNVCRNDCRSPLPNCLRR